MEKISVYFVGLRSGGFFVAVNYLKCLLIRKCMFITARCLACDGFSVDTGFSDICIGCKTYAILHGKMRVKKE